MIKKSVYLAGPIDLESYQWRDEVTAWFGDVCWITKHNIKWTVFNPEKFEVDFDNHSEIVNGDIRMIDKSDVCFFNVTKLSVGTSMEFVYAHQFKKLVVAAIPDDFLNPWHSHHSTVIRETVQSVKEYIINNVKYL